MNAGSCAIGRSALEQVEAPVTVADIELTQPSPGFGPTGAAERVLALVRVHTYPIGTVLLSVGPDGMSSDQVADVIGRRLDRQVAAHLRRDGIDRLEAGPRLPQCLQQRAAILADPPLVSVIVATRDRPASLARCLDSLLAVEFPRLEVIVVDNDPTTPATAELVAGAYTTRGVRYVCERRRGLAAAHNRGVEVATGDLLAFTDDDVVVDRHWVAALAEAFVAADGVGAVTGLIQPGELRTPAQLLLEQHGDFAKGFEPRIVDLDSHRPEDPRFPLASGRLGSGANMAFNARCLRRLGGFNPALGTGTAAKGGDDLAVFFRTLCAGFRLVYQPAALVRHWHRETTEAVAAQAYGYGVGLGAYLTDALVHEPAMTFRTALQAAWAGQAGYRSHPAGWSPDLVRLGRRGAIVGPIAYAASCWRARGARRPN